MVPRSRLFRALPRIKALFEQQGAKVLTPTQMRELFHLNSKEWNLPASTSLGKFLSTLLQETQLAEVRIELPFRPVTRYLWGQRPDLEVVQSLSPVGYFSHLTAFSLNSLTTQAPKTVYFNVEQKLSGGTGVLSQAGINNAFRRECRVSNNRTVYNDVTLVVLNGQNTGNLGVVPVAADFGSQLRVTNVERTLLDGVIRPVYSGGPQHVLEAFVAAKEHVLPNRLLAYLRKVPHTYPYHQSLGWYLERAGYPEAAIRSLKEMPMEFDFYLDYGMGVTDYDASWRLFVPKGI